MSYVATELISLLVQVRALIKSYVEMNLHEFHEARECCNVLIPDYALGVYCREQETFEQGINLWVKLGKFYFGN